MKPVAIFDDKSYIIFADAGNIYREGKARDFILKHPGKTNGELRQLLTEGVLTTTDSEEFKQLREETFKK
jgi:hypothetical protein